MAKRLIVGILSSCDPGTVAQTVAATGLDRSALSVVTGEDLSEVMGHKVSGDMTRGTGVLPDFGGTYVPGTNDTGGRIDAFAHPDVLGLAADIDIPGGDSDFYNDAIDDGRCIIVHRCDDATLPAAQQAFEKAGLTGVRVF